MSPKIGDPPEKTCDPPEKNSDPPEKNSDPPGKNCDPLKKSVRREAPENFGHFRPYLKAKSMCFSAKRGKFWAF